MKTPRHLQVVHAADQAMTETTVGQPVPGLRLDQFGEVLTIEETAKVLRISRASAYELARRWRSDNPSGIPVIQIGRRLLVPRSALEQLLAQPSRLHAFPASAGSADGRGTSINEATCSAAAASSDIDTCE